LSLSATVYRRYAEALRAGALQPVATTARYLEDGGIRFVIRVAAGLREKVAVRQIEAHAGDRPHNPFLPYDPALFVAALSPTHVVLFNKFNVLDRHLLIVTRAFEDQETLLTAADWEALWQCLAEVDGLGFYNGGQAAGASQPHKHLQLVPLPLAGDGPAIPIAPVLARALDAAGHGTTAAFPFRHAFARLDPALVGAVGAAAAATCYRRLLTAVGGCGDVRANGGAARQTAPYNMLVTRDWMLVIARSRDAVAGISVNALGYAGSLFVRDSDEARLVETIGPLRLLAAVAAPLA
jgi:ATP adenylyltransferase